MTTDSYTTAFTVDQSPEEVFKAIVDMRGWWSQNIDGYTGLLGASFKYRFQDVHRCTLKTAELEPGRKVRWHVVDNDFNFIADKSEWKDTDIVFEIARKDGRTEVRFTHVGLVPDYACYNICRDAWGTYVNESLRDLIVTGKGRPNPIESIVARAEDMRRGA